MEEIHLGKCRKQLLKKLVADESKYKKHHRFFQIINIAHVVKICQN